MVDEEAPPGQSCPSEYVDPALELAAPAPPSDEEEEEAPPRVMRRARRAAAVKQAVVKRNTRLSKRNTRNKTQQLSRPSSQDRGGSYYYGSEPFVEIIVHPSSVAVQQRVKSVTFAVGTKPAGPHLWKPAVVINRSFRLSAKFALRVSKVIIGDGNCMFRAVSLHLYGTQDRHMTVRGKAIDHLSRHPELLAFMEDRNHYLSDMEKEGTWGDELMLTTIAATYNITLLVYSGHLNQQAEYSVTYPHSALGPHYGLFFYQGNQHYEVLF